MVIDLNAIMKWYGLTPQSNLYFKKSDLSPLRAAPGLYSGNPKKIRWIKLNKLKSLMKERNVDVEVVGLPSILESTQYKRKLFLIQGYAQKGENMRKDKDGVPDPLPRWKVRKGKTDDYPFFKHMILLEWRVGRYIDHVIRSKNSCLILNPVSHLQLLDNPSRGGYFKHIKFVVKLTYTT
jgi:hypothetical protein